MNTPLVLKSLKQVATLPALPKGRVYLVVAPFAWGKDTDPVKAVRIARSQFSESLAGKFKFLVHDAPASTTINDYGNSSADVSELDASGPAVVVATYRTKEADYR